MDTGTGEPVDGELALEEEEPGSWLDDGRPSMGDEDELDEETEDEALTEGSEPAGESSADDWDTDELELDDKEGMAADAGEEGFGDEAMSGEFDLERLPPLDDASANESDDPEIEAFAALLPDELDELLGGLQCTRLPVPVRVETMRAGVRALVALGAAGDVGLGWDGGLLVVEPHAVKPERRLVSGEMPLALAASKAGGSALIVLALPSGLSCSKDAGQSFTSVALPEALGLVSALAITEVDEAVRIWAAAPHGSLWASDDLGATFRVVREDLLVVALRCSDARTLLVLGRAADGSARCLRSIDGQTFSALALASTEVERVQDLQACREVALCARRALAPQLVWQASESAEWLELAPQAAPPALLLSEGSALQAYFVAALGSRTLLLRRELGASAGAPQIVSEIDAAAGLPLQLAGAHEDGVTTLQLGTERAWYRLSFQTPV
jgi:hypothetical protein